MPAFGKLVEFQAPVLSVRFPALLVLSTFALGGCTAMGGDSISPSGDAESRSFGITCQLGCLETDPNPSAPGYFLGSGVDDIVCFDGSHTDGDQDGLSNLCEKELAAAFAPQLAYASSDRTDREPRWAARPTEDGRVRIAYLLSYYTDDGPTTSWCNTNIEDPFTDACAGHFGDSEVIALDVYFHEGYDHWVLATARYSAHAGINTYNTTTGSYPTALYYPGKKGGFPRAFVAYQKHANYASDAECDGGSIFGSDNCIANTFQRVTAPGPANIGSRAHQSIDCVGSNNPVLSGNGIEECYWTVRPFTGWSGGAPTADPYSTILTLYGF